MANPEQQTKTPLDVSVPTPQKVHDTFQDASFSDARPSPAALQSPITPEFVRGWQEGGAAIKRVNATPLSAEALEHFSRLSADERQQVVRFVSTDPYVRQMEDGGKFQAASESLLEEFAEQVSRRGVKMTDNERRFAYRQLITDLYFNSQALNTDSSRIIKPTLHTGLMKGLVLLEPQTEDGKARLVNGKPVVGLSEFLDRKSIQPGSAVMVMVDGKVVDQRLFGAADVGKSRIITPDTHFDLASMSKAFVALAATKLSDQGKLNVDAPITDWLPELKENWSHVTVRHLLTHSTGMPEIYDLSKKNNVLERDLTNAKEIELLRKEKPIFKPGDKAEYCNVGYDLLAVIIERQTGKPFNQALDELVFKPCGMKDTFVADLNKPQKADSWSTGYKIEKDGWKEIEPTAPMVGSGNIRSTLRDLTHWYDALLGGSLESKTIERMFATTHKTNDGKEIPYRGGWFMQEGRSDVFFHTGFDANVGITVLHPSKHIAIVFLSNDQGLEADRRLIGTAILNSQGVDLKGLTTDF